MKKLITLAITLTLSAVFAVPALAAGYSFSSGGDTLSGFGGATSVDTPTTPDPMSANERRNKDAAYFPPPYGIFSGEIPTDASNPYYNNLPTGGFTPQAQDLPPIGNETYAPGSGTVTESFLPTTSQTVAAITTPWYYDNGTIGTLTVQKLNKTINVYEGENLDNLAKGAGHFSSTSAWDGNVALAGHNRGGAAYFSFVKDLQNGDVLIYTTKYGVRKYKVFSKVQVNELDSSSLSWSGENILTLITCVADVPEMRYCVQAREIK